MAERKHKDTKLARGGILREFHRHYHRFVWLLMVDGSL